MPFNSLSGDQKTHLLFLCSYILIVSFDDLSDILFYVITKEGNLFEFLKLKLIRILGLLLSGFLMMIFCRLKKFSGNSFEYFTKCCNFSLLIFYFEFELLDELYLKKEFDSGLLIGVFLLHSLLNTKNFNIGLLFFVMEMIYLALRLHFISGLHVQKLLTLSILLIIAFKFQIFQSKKLPNFKNFLKKKDSIFFLALKEFDSEGIALLDGGKNLLHSNQKIVTLFGSPPYLLEHLLGLELKYVPNIISDKEETMFISKHSIQSPFENFMIENPTNTLNKTIDEFSQHFLSHTKCISQIKLSFEVMVNNKTLSLPDEFSIPKLILTIFYKGNKIKAILIQTPITFDHFLLLNTEKQKQNNKIFFVSHEMRTPLNCIVSMLQILKPLLSDDLAEEYVNPAIISSNFLLYLVQDLLDMAQMESDKFSMILEEFDIKILIFDIIELFRIQASSKNTEISHNISKMVPDIIISDHRRIRQILINLIGNALKFIKKVNGQIIIEISISPIQSSHITIAVKDNGIGIKDEDKKKLFQAFGKINNEETKKINSSGVGLGLMISNNLAINLHPNKTEGLKVESKYGAGTTFSFVIEDKTEMSNVREFSSPKNLNENYQNLLNQKDPHKFLKKQTNSLTNREYFLASEKEDALSKKTFASVRISFSKRLSNVNYYQFTPLLREKSNFNIKEHNEKVMMLKKTLRTNTNKIFIHQPSVHSFCDVMMGKNNIDEYEFSDNKMMIMKELNTLKSCPCPDILIVDDNAFNIYSLRKQLETFNFKIDSANDGEEAIKMVQDFQQSHPCCKNYNVIFMDIEMPGINGYDASKEIRNFFKESGVNFNLKIVGCSAHLKEEIPDLHKKYGMDEFVTKPIIKGRLVVLLAKLLNISYNFKEESLK